MLTITNWLRLAGCSKSLGLPGWMLSALAATCLAGCTIEPFNYQIGAPVALAAQEVSDHSFLAVWQPVYGADGYFLEVTTDSAFSSAAPIREFQLPPMDSTYEVEDLDLAQTYYYRLSSRYDGGNTSDPSNIISVTTETLITPILLLAPGPQRIFDRGVHWTEVPEAVSYQFQLAKDATFAQLLAGYDTVVVGTRLDITLPDFVETYYGRVRATNGSAYSGWSDALSFNPKSFDSCLLGNLDIRGVVDYYLYYSNQRLDSILGEESVLIVPGDGSPPFYSERFTRFAYFSYPSQDQILATYSNYTDSLEQSWTFQVNDLDQIIGATAIDGSRNEVQYNLIYLEGIMQEVDIITNQGQAIYAFTYDNAGNVSQIDQSDGTKITFTHSTSILSPFYVVPQVARFFLSDFEQEGIFNLFPRSYAISSITVNGETTNYTLNNMDGMLMQRVGDVTVDFRMEGCR